MSTGHLQQHLRWAVPSNGGDAQGTLEMQLKEIRQLGIVDPVQWKHLA